LYPDRPALGDALARLAEAGYRIGAGDHGVSEALYIDDPDGNGVEVYWDRPVEQWPQPRGNMVVPMATLPVDLYGLAREGRGREALGEPAPAGTVVGHVHLQVSDIERTTRFYRDELGLDLIAKLGDQAAFLSSNGYHHHVGANTWRSRGGRPPEPGRAGLARVVFAVSSGDELDAVRSRLVEHDRELRSDDGSVVVNDPDGIELALVPA
jgi:catechol 2,3-dioxygenase